MLESKQNSSLALLVLGAKKKRTSPLCAFPCQEKTTGSQERHAEHHFPMGLFRPAVQMLFNGQETFCWALDILCPATHHQHCPPGQGKLQGSWGWWKLKHPEELKHHCPLPQLGCLGKKEGLTVEADSRSLDSVTHKGICMLA